MNLFSAMEIISTGLSAQRTRLNVTASNLANAHTTRTAEGGPYKRKDPVFSTESIQARFEELLGDELAKDAQGVRAVEIVEDNSAPRMVHDPGHPDADENGFVAFPNVSVVEEMVNMIMASRAYEAGTTAMQAMSSVARTAMRIGGR
ncbi:MAG: flagellar basal body rod protein FlgC [Deltaproteobacteria bacterium]|nr:flagellar basal body rod protein FlgC [Deltaproteobacteria bacterium]